MDIESRYHLVGAGAVHRTVEDAIYFSLGKRLELPWVDQQVKALGNNS